MRGYEEVLGMAGAEGTTRWLPDLPVEEYIVYLEELIQLQLEATTFRDQQFATELAALHKVNSELEAGLAAEAVERQRTEGAFRALEAHVTEQRAYLEKLEAELAARPPRAAPSCWPRRSR